MTVTGSNPIEILGLAITQADIEELFKSASFYLAKACGRFDYLSRRTLLFHINEDRARSSAPFDVQLSRMLVISWYMSKKHHLLLFVAKIA
jgi:hypothetical protein